MRLISLKFRGITEESEMFDFSNKVQGLVNVEGGDVNKLRSLLSFAFFGNEDATKYKLPLIVELRFVLAYEEYYIYRKLIRLESGETQEEVRLTNSKGEPVCDQTKDAIDDYIADRISLNKESFEKLLILDREEANQISKDAVTRETIVAEDLTKLASSNKVIEMLEELQDEEKVLVERLEKLEPVSRGELESYEAMVDSDRGTLEEIRHIMAKLTEELQLAGKYKEEMTKLYEATGRLEKLEAKKEEIEMLEKKLKDSKEAKTLSNVFAAYGEILIKVDEDKKKLELINKQLEEVTDKVEKGKESLIKQGDKYAELKLTEEELEKIVNTVLDDAKKNPKNLDIDKLLSSYYVDINRKAEELTEEYNAIQSNYDKLTKANDELIERKIKLRDAFLYKQAVQNGAVIEGKIEMVKQSLDAAKDRRELLTVERATAIEKLETIERETQGEGSEFDTLDKEIRGKHKTVEQAINADVFYKQRLYSKHLLVSRNEVELDAVINKIENVEKANESYQEKLKTLKDRRFSIIKHRERLVAKLALLEEKMTEYMSENRLRDVSERVEYGSRCPICDGFVSVKKVLPLKDTRALHTQIESVKRDITKDDKALLEAEGAIGQYDAAINMGTQFEQSLISTKEEKEAFIAEILNEYNVESIEELFELTKETIEKSKKLQKKVDRYRELEKGFEKQAETKKILNKTVTLIDEDKIPAEDALIEAYSTELAEMQSSYEEYVKYYGDETATELLKKSQVVERECEKLEQEYEARHAEINDINAVRQAVFVDALNHSTHNVPLNLKGIEYDNKQMVVKVFSEYLLAIREEIARNREKMEKAKLRLMATKKVHEKNVEERDSLRDQAMVLDAILTATTETSRTIYADYEQKFRDMGIVGRSDLDRLILGDMETERAEREIEEFEQELANATETVRLYQEGTQNIASYYDNMNENTQALADLKDKEETYIIELGESMAKKKSLTDRFEEISELNKRLATVQSRIKGINDLKPAIQDGAIIAKDFAELIFEKTNSIVRTISKGRYKVVKGTEGAFVLALSEKGKLRTDNLTREEKMLLPFATSAAYNESMLALLGGQIVTAIKLEENENDKASIQPLYDYSQNRDIVVLTSDDNAYNRVISRM